MITIPADPLTRDLWLNAHIAAYESLTEEALEGLSFPQLKALCQSLYEEFSPLLDMQHLTPLGMAAKNANREASSRAMDELMLRFNDRAADLNRDAAEALRRLHEWRAAHRARKS